MSDPIVAPGPTPAKFRVSFSIAGRHVGYPEVTFVMPENTHTANIPLGLIQEVMSASSLSYPVTMRIETL